MQIVNLDSLEIYNTSRVLTEMFWFFFPQTQILRSFQNKLRQRGKMTKKVNASTFLESLASAQKFDVCRQGMVMDHHTALIFRI